MAQHSKSGGRIVVFDLDYTITRNDTFLTFLVFVLLRRPTRWLPALLLPFYYAWHKAGRRDNQWLKERFLGCVASGLSRTAVQDYCDALLPRIMKRDVRHEAAEALRRHRARGDFLVLASASFDFYVARLAAELGFSDAVCTLAEWGSDGRLTGRIDGRNCYGQEKLRRLEAIVGTRNFDSRVVYTDHHSDLPICQWADAIRLVQPTDRLLRALEGQDYLVLDW